MNGPTVKGKSRPKGKRGVCSFFSDWTIFNDRKGGGTSMNGCPRGVVERKKIIKDTDPRNKAEASPDKPAGRKKAERGKG